MDKQYACISEIHGGATVGTLSQIEDWLIDEDINYLHCKFYELGKEVEASLMMKDK